MQFEENNNKKKYMCFCCGFMLDSIEDFKNHIIEKHEEGQDYILCPLENCKAPVRCIKSHFTTKHPGFPLPKTGMMKATIWRDITLNGKIKKKKPKFKQGWYESTKMNKMLQYRSGLEAQVYECLDQWNEVIAYETEPFEIPYIHQGKQHKYTPDIIISFIDGRKECWEIKPSSQTSYKKNKDKWYYANETCKSRGWEFIVITEQGINKLKQAVKEQRKLLLD